MPPKRASYASLESDINSSSSSHTSPELRSQCTAVSSHRCMLLHNLEAVNIWLQSSGVCTSEAAAVYASAGISENDCGLENDGGSLTCKQSPESHACMLQDRRTCQSR